MDFRVLYLAHSDHGCEDRSQMPSSLMRATSALLLPLSLLLLQYQSTRNSRSFYLFHRLYGLPRRHSDLLSLRNGLLHLVDFGVDGMVNSLLGDHDSESVEIREVLLSLTSSNLLRPGSLLERLDDTSLLDCFLHELGLGRASDIDLEVSQRQPADGDLLSLDT